MIISKELVAAIRLINRMGSKELDALVICIEELKKERKQSNQGVHSNPCGEISLGKSQECVLPGYPKEMIERYKKFASMLSLVVNKYAYAIMTEKNRIIMENHLSALVENYFPGKDCKVKVEFNQMKGKANIKLPEWIEKFAKRYFCESCGSEIVDHNQLCHRFGEQFDGM